MTETKIEKTKLREVIQGNRDSHRELFEEAWEGFRDKAIANLESRIQQIKDGGSVSLYIDLQQPEDHTDDYDRVLSMLDYEVRDHVELSEREFAQYVQDDWGWKSVFAETYSSNTGKFLRG